MTVAPSQQSREQRSRLLFTQGQVRVRADDARFFGLTLHAVDLANQIERFFGFWVLALLEQFATCVCDAPSAQPPTGLRDRVVARVHVDDEATLRSTQHLLRNGSAAARR